MNVDELKELLLALHMRRDTELRSQFDRSLPFADALFDRWERARRLGFSEGVSIYDSASVFGDVKVGQHTWIGPNVMLDGSGGGLTIGSYCSISSGVHIYSHDTLAWALTGGKAATRAAPVSIGNCCYVGSQSIIAAGSRIGDQCVVSANSFVNGEVAARTIVGGSPARVLGVVEIRDAEVRLIFE
jgi:acetyltransferase-like isoleucine patch superfamily enzyme